MRIIRLFIIFFTFLVSRTVSGQDSVSSRAISNIPSQYFETVSKKVNKINQILDKKSQNALQRFQKQEKRLRDKLAKIDSIASNNVFANTDDEYKQFQEKLGTSKYLPQYIAALDTTITSLKFLEQNQQLINNVKDGNQKLTYALKKVQELQNQLGKAERIKEFLKERRQYLKEQLSKFGITKELKRINKEVYYFAATLQQYKSILADEKTVERKALELLSKTKLWEQFMRKNSWLASLFRIAPDDPNDPAYLASLGGLQTRAQVNTVIQNQIAVGGASAQQSFQENIQRAQFQMQQLKDKINKWGGSSSDDIMPDGFKPNNQKTKNFLQRLELGTNIQSQKGSNFLPVTSDLGLSLGYKLNDKGVIGIGASYKMGWGSGWNNIRFTHQGIGVRSFLDWKLKGSFWVSSGYEHNYRSEFRNIAQLRNYSSWQQSGLVGVSKIVSVKSNVFRKTKVQLLWDFLSYQQTPRSQPIIFRIGYSIK